VIVAVEAPVVIAIGASVVIAIIESAIMISIEVSDWATVPEGYAAHVIPVPGNPIAVVVITCHPGVSRARARRNVS
jgi:hypothetical protein